MSRYFINGVEVSNEEAYFAWKRSATYRMAKFKDSIWPNAHASDRDGAAREHLAEAGVRIEIDGQAVGK